MQIPMQILIGESRHNFEENARKLIKSSFNMGRAVNEDKTKYMVNDTHVIYYFLCL